MISKHSDLAVSAKCVAQDHIWRWERLTTCPLLALVDPLDGPMRSPSCRVGNYVNYCN